MFSLLNFKYKSYDVWMGNTCYCTYCYCAVQIRQKGKINFHGVYRLGACFFSGTGTRFHFLFSQVKLTIESMCVLSL